MHDGPLLHITGALCTGNRSCRLTPSAAAAARYHIATRVSVCSGGSASSVEPYRHTMPRRNTAMRHLTPFIVGAALVLTFTSRVEARHYQREPVITSTVYNASSEALFINGSFLKNG